MKSRDKEKAADEKESITPTSPDYPFKFIPDVF